MVLVDLSSLDFRLILLNLEDPAVQLVLAVLANHLNQEHPSLPDCQDCLTVLDRPESLRALEDPAARVVQ